jgi:hypothetical protein
MAFFLSSRGFTPTNDIMAVADFDYTLTNKHSGGKPVFIFDDGYISYKDLMKPKEMEQLASLIREFKGYGIPFHIVSWADEALLKQYLQHVLPPDAFALISDKIHGSFNQHYIPKSETINVFSTRKKIIFIDDDEKNIEDVKKNVPGAVAIKAEPGKSSANMVALAVETLRGAHSLGYDGYLHGEIDVDEELPEEAPKSKRHKKNGGGKSKSKRKTKSKRKSKRRTIKK